MGNRYRFMFFLVLLAGSLVASAGPSRGLSLEDYESYVDDAALNAAWIPSANGLESLETSLIFEGDQAMKIESTESSVTLVEHTASPMGCSGHQANR